MNNKGVISMNLIEFLRLTPEEKEQGVWLSGIEGEGEYIEYWENGILSEHCFYKKGNLHGECKWWWEKNGKLKEHSHYKDGKYHGEYKYWYVDGTLVEHSLYENGIEIKDYLK